MLTGKYTSVKRILEDVYRDNGYTQELNWNDCLEWIGYAMDLIGVPMSYLDKIGCINIVDYKGTLPCDLHLIVQTRDKDSKEPMLYASDTFHTGYHCLNSTDLTVNCTNNNCQANAVDAVPSTDDDDNTNCNPFFNSNPNLTTNTSVAAGSAPASAASVSDQITYSLNNNYIFTSFASGTVEMAYKAFPTSEEGYPLIPDDTKYIRAVVSYLTMKIDYKLWRQNKLEEKVYARSEQEWYFNVGAAKTGATIPSLDQMESLKNSWLRSIPKINQHSSSFNLLNNPETRYTKNS